MAQECQRKAMTGGGGQFSEASCYVSNIIVVCVFLVLYGGSGS